MSSWARFHDDPNLVDAVEAEMRRVEESLYERVEC